QNQRQRKPGTRNQESSVEKLNSKLWIEVPLFDGCLVGFGRVQVQNHAPVFDLDLPEKLRPQPPEVTQALASGNGRDRGKKAAANERRMPPPAPVTRHERRGGIGRPREQVD